MSVINPWPTFDDATQGSTNLSHMIYSSKPACTYKPANRIKKTLGNTFFWGVICIALISGKTALAQINYKPVAGTTTGSKITLSPDPLVNMRWPSPKATDELEYYYLQPKSYKTVSPASFDMSNFKTHNQITVNGKGDIRFDFGRVSAGWLEFESEDLADSVVMSISEYNEPAVVNGGPAHPFKTTPVVKNGNTYRILLNSLWYEGVRFGWIHVLNYSHKWHVKNIRLVCQIKPANYNGSFACSDSQLTKIWYTGAYTVKLNLLKDYFGAILMDRGDRHSWTGDAFPAQAASMVAFGNFDFVKKNLNNTANLSNDIASYALYWVLSLIDYVNYTGDIAFAKQHLKNAEQKLDNAYAHFGNNPGLAFYGWDERLGAGFENPQISEAQHAYSMLSVGAWAAFSKLMYKTGDLPIARKYERYAGEKIAAIRQDGAWLKTFGLHAAADAINTTLTTPQENNLFFDKLFTNRVNRLSYSPFNQWFIISAMAKAQRYDEAISAIKDCWGGQLQYGATTFFEVFRPEWNNILNNNDAPPNNQCGYTSFTHPWSAGVVKWLSEETLGIKPLQPGFKTFQIIPHLGRSLTRVSGGTPTINGAIMASFDVPRGNARINIPKGAVAKTLALPLGKNTPLLLKMNGRQVWHSQSTKKAKITLQVTEHEDYLIINNLQAGNYTFELQYKKAVKQKPYAEVPRNYAIKTIKQDSITSGKWQDTYGTEGFILFNYNNQGQHKQQLPAYLENVPTRLINDIHDELPLSAPGLLQANNSGNVYGAITTQNYNACRQTMTIDIPVKDNTVHQVSIYILDQDKKGRRSALEIFDLNTLNLLAPMAYVKNYENGRYVSFNFKGPIRIRVNQVRGINAAVSGIFFDKAAQ